MKKLNFYLAKPQYQKLQELSEESGLTMAEIIRRRGCTSIRFERENFIK